MKISNDHVVSLHYSLRNSRDEVIDSSDGGEPLVYLHGAHNIIPGLESALTGHETGDQMEVSVQPEDGYGPRQKQLQQTLPRDAFEGADEIAVGMQFQRTPEGQLQHILVTAVSENGIEVDANHPLAGEVLHFSVEIVGVRDATAEELEHGHAHSDG